MAEVVLSEPAPGTGSRLRGRAGCVPGVLS